MVATGSMEITIVAVNDAGANLLVLTERTMLPVLRQLGQHESADELIRTTTAYVDDPENAETVALARERGFRWMETGD